MSAEKAAEVVREIRRKYPSPVARPRRVRDEYCVSIAASMYLGYPVGTLMIVSKNDSGDFEGAWTALEQALVEYG